jgi:protein SCO1/2
VSVTGRRQSPRLAAALGVAVLVLVATGCGGANRAAPPATTAATAGLRGLIPTPAPRKPDFLLTDTGGRRFRLAAKTRGKLTYLYFGYTHCPDACPLTMADIAAALRHQPARIRNRIEVVFVTVDPRRDTPKVLRAWLDRYNRSFIGLTGGQAAIRAAERAAQVPLAPPEKQKGVNYSVSHSTLVLPYSPDNRAHVLYSEGFTAADYAHDMPLLLAY